ncbi:MAG: hypothetical protein KDA80_12115 [Planctomycetaceae bacterium]|nr:hypothetical protein [Planctomycetaceae bacterium]
MEKKFMEMQAKPSAPILSELPQAEIHSYDDSETDDTDDDFELSTSQGSGGATGNSLLDDAPSADEESSSSEESGKEVSDEKSSQGASSDSDVAHSVATGGDALLDIARAEEQESQKRRKSKRVVGGMRTPGGGILIFCPYGCRVEVKEQHRGMTGKCPKCRAPFIVPVDPPMFKKSKKDDAGAGEKKTGSERTWLEALHLHIVSPEKLKIKADSLVKEFTEADFGFSEENLIVAILGKKGGGGMFSRGGDKKGDPREQMLEHLKEGKPVDDLPVSEKYVFTTEEMAQIRVVQPTASRTDSIFHGIPVFGEGRIAVQLPLTDAIKDPIYVSMGITQFWDFAKALEKHFDITGLGAGAGIPPEHVYSRSLCFFLQTPIKFLENIEFYKADSSVELMTIGYRCEKCGTTISEDGRKKESLGGKSPKGIAKAKCPKCSNKMGENFLQDIKENVEEAKIND